MRRPRDREFFTFGMGHHRCYRNKATEKYLLLGRSGVEFINVASGEATAHHFIRGTCQYGIFPGNGLLYLPPHSCACFIEARLNGFNALVPKRQNASLSSNRRKEDRLERGPAYGTQDSQKDTRGRNSGARTCAARTENAGTGDWPTYRHDVARSGYTREKISAKVANSWKTNLGGRLSSPVVAEGMVFVSAIDTHTIHALDADSGERLWSYTAGGRVDSPPTIYQGLALFGSADGQVYCVRASDGVLVWRFLAAREDRRIVAYGQVESVWPVPGSVLVLPPAPVFRQEDAGAGRSGQAAAYVAVGRSSYLDGGMYLYRFDPRTGKVLSKTKIDNRDPETDLPPQDTARGVNMPGALPDVLSSDGLFVYMRHMRFDREGVEQKPDVPHLFCPAGFLDDSWWHRTYWIYGIDMNSGWGGWTTIGNQTAVGRLLVLDESLAYGFGRLNQYDTHGSHVGLTESLTPWPLPERSVRARGTTHYRLFACSKQPEVIETVIGEVQTKKGKRRPRTRKDIKYHWSKRLGLIARAMVIADEILFVAGPPELLSTSSEALSSSYLSQAQAAYEGKQGALLYAVWSGDGRKLAEHRLESVPVFDGMAAAYGRLYISMKDGSLRCLAPVVGAVDH